VLTGSLHEVPAALLAQLRPQGRLLAIVGDEPVMQAVRIQGGARTELFDTVAARLPGATEPSPFVF
jgi:protein-L-isoaspartate(D-aspartate) O-methyltransferase